MALCNFLLLEIWRESVKRSTSSFSKTFTLMSLYIRFQDVVDFGVITTRVKLPVISVLFQKYNSKQGV